MTTSTITPKQQSFLRKLLEERKEVLGITDIEAFIRDKGIDRLTVKDASAFIDKVKSIVPPRNPEHAHLPEGFTMPNKRAVNCASCDWAVGVGEGWVVKTPQGWVTYHKRGECFDEPSVLSQVPCSYFAIPSLTGNNDLDFFWVHVKNGQKELLRVLGGHKPFRMSLAETRKVAEVLAGFSDSDVYDANARFGRELGVCGRCGRSLTDESSRAVGLGPECAKHEG